MVNGMIGDVLKMYKLSELHVSHGECSCCGNEGGTYPMIRPEVRPLSDRELIEMADEFGVEYAVDYHESSGKYTRTRECLTCREEPDDHYFFILLVREDR